MKRLGKLRIYACLLMIYSCALFQRDPVGASLVTMRNGYESVIKESGAAYQAGAITKVQLGEIVQVGRKFYDAYVLATNAYLLQAEGEAEKQRLEAARLLAALQGLARKYYGGGKT